MLTILFDGIAYGKAASVLRAVEAYVGPAVFQKGVNAYLQKHAYANATAEEHARFVADVQGMLNWFFEDTGWHPRRVKPVAGAETDTSRDYEFTDWVALDHFVEEVADEISRSTTGSGA